MPYTRKNALRGGTARPRRRRTSMARKFSRRRASTYNNKRSVVTLARAVSRNSAVLRAQRIWTDYQYFLAPELPGFSQLLENDTWYSYPLTDVSKWESCLRRDTNVEQSARCFVSRMQMNLRLELRDSSSFVNVFLVTLRKDAVSKLDDLAAGFSLPGEINPLTENNDFIEGQITGANLRLNPAIFKVHAVWYKTLVANQLAQAPVDDQNVGNPNTTWCKKQWNTRLNTTIRSPIGKQWSFVPFDQMPYYNKYYLLCYAHTDSTLPNPQGPLLSVDTLYTAINQP